MKLKDFLKVLITFAVISGIIVVWAVFKDYQREANTNEVIDRIERDTNTVEGKIQAIIDSTVTIKKEEYPYYFEEKPTKPDDVDVSGIVSGAIDDVVEPTDDALSSITVLSSDTFSATQNGQEKKFRLIGVKSNGSMEGLQLLLDSATDLQIEFDTIKSNSDGLVLVYLWDGEPADDCSNMINMQMILNGYANTTYLLTSDSVSETPNIKYSTTFIKYQKLVQTN